MNYIKTLSISQKVLMWEACEDGNPLKQLLEDEFQKFSKEENDLSVEELFKLSFIDNNQIVVYYLPNTNSYRNYGQSLNLLEVEIDEKSKALLLESVNNGHKTKGCIRFRALKLLGEDDIVAKVNTNDIYRIEIVDFKK